MPDPVRRTALIAGAGIGGLSAGIALRQAGWDVRIYERTAVPRELGFGLGLAPYAVSALRELGVARRVLDEGFVPGRARAEIRRTDGRVLKRFEISAQEAFGGSFAMVLRPSLHGALLAALGSDAIVPSREVTGFSQSGQKVRLQMADGVDVEGDLLVGADGLGSAVRRALHPSEPTPRDSGLVSVRGAAHRALHHLGDLAAVYYLGRGIESAIIRAGSSGIYWFVSVARELVRGVTDPLALLSLVSPKLDATFKAVTAASDDLRLDELVDRDPLPSWGTGVVTLLGDAAHTMLPHTGQGAGQAILDGVVLGRSMREHADVAVALRSYEEARRKKTDALVAQGRRTARIMRMTSPAGCLARDAFVRMIPITTLAKVFARIRRR